VPTLRKTGLIEIRAHQDHWVTSVPSPATRVVPRPQPSVGPPPHNNQPANRSKISYTGKDRRAVVIHANAKIRSRFFSFSDIRALHLNAKLFVYVFVIFDVAVEDLSFDYRSVDRSLLFLRESTPNTFFAQFRF